RPDPDRPSAPGQVAPAQARRGRPPAGRGAARPGQEGPGPTGPAMSALLHQRLEVTENLRLARNTYRIRLHGPELARAIRPGQFLMLRLPDTTDPLLGRPFALYDTVLEAGRPVALDVVYLVVGKMTGRLVSLGAGDRLDAWGPLGNGFADLEGIGHVAL